MDEPCSKVLVNELTQSCKFFLGQEVNGAERRGSAFIQCDFEIVGRWLANLPALDLLNMSVKSW